MVTLNTVLNRTKKISAEKFAKMSKQERAGLSVVRILPPSLSNDDDFGKIEVRSNQPVYEVSF